MRAYIDSGLRELLGVNGLNNFDAIWDLDADWFEPPNKRRSGWSGVSKVNLQTNAGKTIPVFLKRQENHNTKSWAHPFKGTPTFYREFKNIIRCRAKNIATVEPIYFNCRYKHGNSQAILITKALTGFDSLDATLYARDSLLLQNKPQRQQLMVAVASVMRQMHYYRLQHNCLYAKHIFVRLSEAEAGRERVWEVRLLDLEKLKRTLFHNQAMLRDLSTLSRHISAWKRCDKLQFLKIYRCEDKLSAKSKAIWRAIQRINTRKNSA